MATTPDAPDSSGVPQLPSHLDPRSSGGSSSGRSSSGETGSRRSQSANKAGIGRDVRRGLSIGGQALATLLALSILVGSYVAWATYRSVNSQIRRANVSVVVPQANGSTTPTTSDVDGKDQNILIVGNDDRDTATDAELNVLGIGRDDGSLNTDTMMLMHVPADGKKATAISFPRDSYVAIPGYGKDKLNAAYNLGSKGGTDKDAGAQLLLQTISNLTGLKIDHFVQVDLIGFYRISEAIGGVEVCLNNAVHEVYSGVNLPAGVQTIDGVQALAFVRQRYNFPSGNGDLDRIKRQQTFLSAAFRKIESAGTLLNYGKLQNLVKAVSSSLTVDSGLDLLKLATQMSKLSAGNVTFTTIPTLGFANEDVGSVVVVDSAGLPDFVNTVIGANSTDAAYAKATAAPASTVTVDVFNGGAPNGTASTNATALRGLGFTVGTVDTSAATAATTIRYPAGMEAQAKALAAAVTGAKVVKATDVTRVTLRLGSDGVQANVLMPAPTAGTATTTTPAAGTGTETTGSSRTASDTSCID